MPSTAETAKLFQPAPNTGISGQSNMTKRDIFFKGEQQQQTNAHATLSNSTSNNHTNSSNNSTNDSGGSVRVKQEREVVVQLPESTVKGHEGYVGFANLPNQVFRKSVKKGFEFTLMVVGESGLGKSTLINSLFLTDLYSNEYPGPSQRIKKTVQVETTKVMLKENGVQLSLTVVDTPGFGDAVDNSECWQPVTEFIERKYEEFLIAETKVNRKSIPDNRVHCCLYFIAPSGHGLKPLDIEFMKRLHDKVNIIPLIAKADTLTPEECQHFKKTILNEIAQHKIQIYDFPDCEDDEDEKYNRSMKERVPFAVVGSNTLIDLGGKKARGRKYPWGVVEVESMEHCDFMPLRNMVIRTHMHDLKDITNNVHYENYRVRKLAGVTHTVGGKIPDKSPFAQMEEEKKDHVVKMKKMEKEMEQVFEQKVKEKQNKLKDSEADLQRRHEQMKKSLEQQEKELELKRQEFAREKELFDEEARRHSLEKEKHVSMMNIYLPLFLVLMNEVEAIRYMEDYCYLHMSLGEGSSSGGELRLTSKSSYQTGWQCEVVVLAPPERRLLIVFNTLEVHEAAGNCRDYLEIYDGANKSTTKLTPPGGLCGYARSPDQLPLYNSTDRYLTLVFTSPGYSIFSDAGFSLVYTAYHQGRCRKEEFRCSDTPLCISDALKCDGNNNCADLSDESGRAAKAGCSITLQFSTIIIIFAGIGLLLLLFTSLCLYLVICRRSAKHRHRAKQIAAAKIAAHAVAAAQNAQQVAVVNSSRRSSRRRQTRASSMRKSDVDVAVDASVRSSKRSSRSVRRQRERSSVRKKTKEMEAIVKVDAAEGDKIASTPEDDEAEGNNSSSGFSSISYQVDMGNGGVGNLRRGVSDGKLLELQQDALWCSPSMAYLTHHHPANLPVTTDVNRSRPPLTDGSPGPLANNAMPGRYYI